MPATDTTIEELNAKLDRLATQVEFLTDEAMANRRRRLEWDELKSDLTPIFSDVYSVAVRELAELDGAVDVADLAHVLKRMVRSLPLIERMFDQMESASDLVGEISPLTGSAFVSAMEALDRLERKGYFEFAREGIQMADHVVESFTVEDVRSLGDNIVLILNTVKEMTQPEVMTMLRRTASTVREQDTPEDISLFALMKEMRDPTVKKGLARVLGTLRTLSGEGTGSTSDEQSNERNN